MYIAPKHDTTMTEEKAKAAVLELMSDPEEDWTYKAVNSFGIFWVIQIYDEDGFFMGNM